MKKKHHNNKKNDKTTVSPSPAHSSSPTSKLSPLKHSSHHYQFAVLLGVLNIILTFTVMHFHSNYISSSSSHSRPLPGKESKQGKEITHRQHFNNKTTTQKQPILYSNDNNRQQEQATTTTFQDAVTYGPLGLRGVSHVCINVPNVDKAAEFYHRVLGYEIMTAGEKWGNFDLRNLHSEEFCKSAGFMDGKCRLDCLWMKHPTININLELFHYHEPNVVNRLEQENWLSNTQDIGGFKHISYAVQDAKKAFEFLKTQEGVRFISDDPDYQPIKMVPFPFKFFYWIDPYGVQWECEDEGDEIVTHQIAGVTRNVDKYIEYKEQM